MTRLIRTLLLVAAVAPLIACRADTDVEARRATGYVEATDVRVAARVPGRVVEVAVIEGERVEAGAPVASLATTELDLALRRATAERAQAEAQLRLLQRGARPEDIAQAEAQLSAARAEQQAVETERNSAALDEARFVQLVERRAGAEKQRDDATARRRLAEARVAAAADRAAAAEAALARLRAGARREEIDVARARLAAVDVQIATLEHDRRETALVAPVAGVVTARLVEPGELVPAGAPVATIVDLDRAWVNAYVEEPMVPSLRIGQDVRIETDGGEAIQGHVAFVAPRAEFTPRNVQTADERSRLVYRVRVNVDNRDGLLKPGMPVEVTW